MTADTSRERTSDALMPLKGKRVIDLTHQVAGPYCSMILADLGAEVIKVERPPVGDTARMWPTFGPSIFFALNRNKKSIALDLNQEKDKAVFQKLVKSADVLVENMAPGVTEKLGADYESVKKLNNSIIYCKISGYGKSNEYSNLPAWDPVIQALSGLMSVTGEKERDPVRIGVSVVDMGAGVFGALGIVSALLARKESRGNKKKQQCVFLDISLFDSATVWMSFWVVYYSLFKKLPERFGSAWPAFAPYQAFRAKDGYVFIAASNEDFWRNLCSTLDLSGLAEDPLFATNELRLKNAEELVARVQRKTQSEGRDYLVSQLRKAGVPCAPVNSVADLVEDKILWERGAIKKMGQGEKEFLSIASPLGSSGFEAAKELSPPALGQDTKEIMRSLGYTKPQIKKFLESSLRPQERA